MKIFVAKKKGQALLTVIVVSALALLIILGISDRITDSYTNIRRSSEFDRSLVVAENKVNDVINAISAKEARDCVQNATQASITTSEYQELICTGINNGTENAKIYVRRSSNDKVALAKDVPLTFIFGNGSDFQTDVDTTAIQMQCSEEAVNASVLLSVTRGYLISGSKLAIDKAVVSCNDLDDMTEIQMKSISGGAVIDTNSVVSNTVFVKIRVVDTGTAITNPLVSARVMNGTEEVVSTKLNEFMITGSGILGSDSLVTFELPVDAIASFSPSIFDYAILNEYD